MATKIFIDTNLLIDFFDSLRSGHANAVKLFKAMEEDEISGFVSESVLNTTVYILRKQYSSNELRSILEDMLSFIDILPCTAGIYLNSLKLSGADIENALLYQLALENGVDYFITENKKDFKKFAVPALPFLSSKEFIQTNK